MDKPALKNSVSLVLSLLVLLFFLGLFFYQNKLQEESEARIADTIWEQVEYRIKTKDSIKQDIEEKKKTQELLIQLDYENQVIEVVKQEMEGLEARQIQRNVKLEELFFNQEQDQQKQQEEQEARLTQYHDQAQECAKGLQEAIDKIDELNHKILENNRKIAQLQEAVELQKEEMARYRQQLEEALRQPDKSQQPASAEAVRKAEKEL